MTFNKRKIFSVTRKKKFFSVWWKIYEISFSRFSHSYFILFLLPMVEFFKVSNKDLVLAKLELESLVFFKKDFWLKIEYSSLRGQAWRPSSFSYIMEIVLVAYKKNLNFGKLTNFFLELDRMTLKESPTVFNVIYELNKIFCR